MMLGMPAITGFDEVNNNAKLCKQFFPVLRDRVLRDHLWSFAQTSIDLQRTDEKSMDPRYPYVCSLPLDLIRIVEVVGGHPYRRNGKRILLNRFPASLIYVRSVENPEEFDVTFTEALQYLLAAEIGSANTLNAHLINMYRQEYEKRLAIARSIDSAENYHTLQGRGRTSTYLAARSCSGEVCPGVGTPVNWVKPDGEI